MGGASAGGNLAAATILRAGDDGLALPAGAVPATDLTEAGDTWLTGFGLDNILTERATPVRHPYAAGHDLRRPYLSPIYADFTKGFPPSLLLFGNTRRVAVGHRPHERIRRRMNV